MKNKKCSICGKPLENKFGNNAEPINEGRCCDVCNMMVVVPERISRFKLKQ